MSRSHPIAPRSGARQMLSASHAATIIGAVSEKPGLGRAENNCHVTTGENSLLGIAEDLDRGLGRVQEHGGLVAKHIQGQAKHGGSVGVVLKHDGAWIRTARVGLRTSGEIEVAHVEGIGSGGSALL